jgi:hypothetical protein
MEPTDQGECSQGLFEAMQKRSAMYRRWLRTVAACTDILPPRLIADRYTVATHLLNAFCCEFNIIG